MLPHSPKPWAPLDSGLTHILDSNLLLFLFLFFRFPLFMAVLNHRVLLLQKPRC